MADRLKLRLTIDVDYDLNGCPPEDVEARLRQLPHIAAGEGMMTGELEATVDEWSSKLERRE